MDWFAFPFGFEDIIQSSDKQLHRQQITNSNPFEHLDQKKCE
jgi:hypothetical protein